MVVEYVSLTEVLAAARGRHASLVPESSGYLLLGLFQATAGRPNQVDPSGIMLSSEGIVSITQGRKKLSAERACEAIRQLLSDLLAAAKGRSPALAALARESTSGRLDLLAAGITKALIPINRGAAKRALARLARETLRAKASGLLQIDESLDSSSALAPAAGAPAADAGGAAAEAGAPSTAASGGSGPAEDAADEVAAAATELEDWDDLDVDIELATPTPAPAVELATDSAEEPAVTDPREREAARAAEPAEPASAPAAETVEGPSSGVPGEVCSEADDGPRSVESPELELASVDLATADLGADRPTMPDLHAVVHAEKLAANAPPKSRHDVALEAEEHLVHRLLSDEARRGKALATPQASVASPATPARPAFAKAPGDASSADALLERFAEGDGDMDQLLVAASDLTRLVVADASPTPPPAVAATSGLLSLLKKHEATKARAGAERDSDDVESCAALASPAVAELEAQAEPELEAQAEPELEAQAEPELEAQAEPEPEAQAEPEPEAQAEPEPEVAEALDEELPPAASDSELAPVIRDGDLALARAPEELLDCSAPIPMVVRARTERPIIEPIELSPSALPVSCAAEELSMSVLSTEISLIPNDAVAGDEPVLDEPAGSEGVAASDQAVVDDLLAEAQPPADSTQAADDVEADEDDDHDEQASLDAEVAFSVSPAPVQVEDARNTVSGLPPPGSEHRRRWPVAASLVTLLTGMAALSLVVMRPAWLSDVLPTSVTEPVATEAAGERAGVAETGPHCYAKLNLTGLPSPHEILLRLGEAPLTTRPLPTGVRLELMAMATGQQPQRVVIPADARWVEVTEGERKLAVDLLLEPTSDPAWPAAEPGQVGGVGPEGRIHVTTDPSAEIWLVAGVGEEERQSIVVPCVETAHILVVDPGAPAEPYRLSVAPKLLEAAAQSGGADIPVRSE